MICNEISFKFMDEGEIQEEVLDLDDEYDIIEVKAYMKEKPVDPVAGGDGNA